MLIIDSDLFLVFNTHSSILTFLVYKQNVHNGGDEYNY